MKQKVAVITGMTATGKSKVAIELAKICNAEIISADSRMIYKGVDIASAKPEKSELEEVKHHLVDILEPVENFSAGDFERHGKKAIEDITSGNKNVIVAGGTWFYIQALLGEKNLLNVEKDESLREELKIFYQKNGKDELHKMLEKLDPKRAEQIHKNDVKKVVRAIEMTKLLDKSVSKVERKDNENFEPIYFGLTAEREVLYERINKRVDEMLEKGLYEEFQGLIKKYGENEILKNTIGIGEFIDYDCEEAIEKIKQHTRNYAKRQNTYFRSNDKIIWFDTNKNSLNYIIDMIYKNLKSNNIM